MAPASRGAGALLLAFGYGAGVGAFRWPPHGALRAVHQGALRLQSRPSPDQELLRLAFTEPLLDREQIHPPIHSLEGIRRTVARWEFPAGLFFDAYAPLEIKRGDRLTLDGRKRRC